MKVLFALMLLLFSFGAVAESHDASTIAAYDPDDCFEGNTEQNTISAQIIATKPTIENLGEIVEESDILHVHFLNLSTASTTPGLTPGVVAIVDHAAGCRKLSRLVDQ